jgi:acetylornithine aminotransferase
MKCNLVLEEAGSFAHQYHDIKYYLYMQKVWVTVFQLWYFNCTFFEASYGLLELLLVKPSCLCAASIAILDILESQNLMENAKKSRRVFHGSYQLFLKS